MHSALLKGASDYASRGVQPAARRVAIKARSGLNCAHTAGIRGHCMGARVVKLTEFKGFLTVEPKPSSETLRAFYQEKYFAADTGNQYAAAYSPEEVTNKLLDCHEAALVLGARSGRLLDVGCGEGYFMGYFAARGWEVAGLDFTADGVAAFNPEVADRVRTGDLFGLLDEEIGAGRRYDFVTCNNVLEHVVDPLGLLDRLHNLIAADGICRLRAPNDNSWLQESLVARDLAPADYWVCPPEHLNYFNGEALQRVLVEADYEIADLFGDFPIELYLLNAASNYKLDRAKGKAAHHARVAFENALYEHSRVQFFALRRAFAHASVGRNTTAYIKSKRARR